MSQVDKMMSHMVHSGMALGQLLKEKKTSQEFVTKLRNGLPVKRGKK